MSYRVTDTSWSRFNVHIMSDAVSRDTLVRIRLMGGGCRTTCHVRGNEANGGTASLDTSMDMRLTGVQGHIINKRKCMKL